MWAVVLDTTAFMWRARGNVGKWKRLLRTKLGSIWMRERRYVQVRAISNNVFNAKK